MLNVMEKASGERRKINIKAVAEKTGIILDDGELWNGVERRSEVATAKERKAPRDYGYGDKNKTPTDFFG
ncbi:hypothetical protein MNBD_NITROSPINAE01-973 [hydrothermal vent metagenome]|uniref:Uncharacterized protein n=1 Tax=hydrothermal vent metagenome TaxID=652676 RepID=A0A3B1BNH8_9ZZZZ